MQNWVGVFATQRLGRESQSQQSVCDQFYIPHGQLIDDELHDRNALMGVGVGVALLYACIPALEQTKTWELGRSALYACLLTHRPMSA